MEKITNIYRDKKLSSHKLFGGVLKYRKKILEQGRNKDLKKM